MPQIPSGSVLREARERKGYDLTTVARRLRIRPDILRAIESNDFSNMPPRGYTRNMVNAYARFLGLNPTEIVNMYLDEAYAYQVEKARGSAPGSGFVMDGYQRRPRIRSGSRSGSSRDDIGADGRRQVYLDDDDGAYGSPVRSGSRHLYDDRTQYSHDGYGVTRDSSERSGRSDRDFLSHHSGYTDAGRSSDYNFGSRGSRHGRGGIQVGQTPMQYSASRIPAILRTRGFLMAIAVVVVVILVAIVFFVIGNNNQDSNDNASTLPISGISDTTGTSDDEADEAVQVEIAPTSARVSYSVSSGDECYVEIYTDGTLSTTELLSGPAQESVDVTGTWTMTTWSPETISVTVDGEEVELVSNEEYGGMYAYTVDFAKILEEWNSTHNSKSSQRQAAVATASNAAQQASAASDDDEGSSSSSSTADDSSASDEI